MEGAAEVEEAKKVGKNREDYRKFGLLQVSYTESFAVLGKVGMLGIFPPKVVSRRDKQITINRGDGTDIAVGQIWNVFAVGEELIDPDTGENLGREEVLVGKVKITGVLPKTSSAEILEDHGIDKMAILRKSQ